MLALSAVLLLVPTLTNSSYLIGIGIFTGIHTIVVFGLLVVSGLAGQVSLGHAAFYGVGAYTSGLLTTKLGLTPILGVVGALLLAAAVAYLVGRPVLRLRGHYLAMATMGFGIIVSILMVEWYSLTHGPSGFGAIPAFTIGSPLVSDAAYYYVVCIPAVLLMLLMHGLTNSRLGRAFRAIQGSEVASQLMAINVEGLKLQAFVLSAVFAALGGALYAHYVRYVNPSPFGFVVSIKLLVMLVVGGSARAWGPLAGAAIVTSFSEIVRGRWNAEYEMTAFGLLLVALMLFWPDGLSGAVSDLRVHLGGVRKQIGSETGGSP